MKIVHVVETYYPNVTGPSKIIHELSKRLVKIGIECEVVTTTHKAEGCKEKETIDGVKVRRFPIKRQFMLYMITPEMKRYLEKVKCDVIHCHNYRGYHTQISSKIARKRGIPFILTPHGGLLGYDHYLTTINKTPYKIFDLLTRKQAAKKADAIIVLSEEEEEDAISYGVPKSHIHRIPVGIDISEYRPKKKTHKGMCVLFVGRIAENRNLAPIIEAAAILKRKKPEADIKFYIVGKEVKTSSTTRSGYLEKLKRLVQTEDVKDRVSFLGPKYGKDLLEHYRTSDIFIYTSKSENFGMPLLEAAAAGLPTITTKVGIAKELIEDGKNGYFVKSNPAKAIVKLLNAERRKRFSKYMLKKVQAYQWKNIMEEYIRLYKSLISSKT